MSRPTRRSPLQAVDVAVCHGRGAPMLGGGLRGVFRGRLDGARCGGAPSCRENWPALFARCTAPGTPEAAVRLGRRTYPLQEEQGVSVLFPTKSARQDAPPAACPHGSSPRSVPLPLHPTSPACGTTEVWTPHVGTFTPVNTAGLPSPGCGTSSGPVLVGHGEDIEDGVAPKEILLENGPLPPVL